MCKYNVLPYEDPTALHLQRWFLVVYDTLHLGFITVDYLETPRLNYYLWITLT